MKKKYRSAEQRSIVIKSVEALVSIAKERNTSGVLSMETLNLIFDRYCYLADPSSNPGQDERYDE